MESVPDEDIERFRERVEGRDLSPSSFPEYERWIRRFEMWHDGGEPGLVSLEDFDSLLARGDQIVYPWVNDRGADPPEVYAYQTRILALSAVKKWVRRNYNKRIPEEPDEIALGEPEPFDPTYIPRERVNQIINEAPSACNATGCKTALAVSYDAILRAVELTRITRNDFSFPDGEPASVDVTAAKKSRNATISLSEDTTELLRSHLESLPAGAPAPFLDTYGEPWGRKGWSSHVSRYHAEEGSHSLGRHSPILHLLESGTDFGEVYRRARHVVPQTTSRYARYIGTATPNWAGGA